MHGPWTRVTLLTLLFSRVYVPCTWSVSLVWFMTSYWQWQQMTHGVADRVIDNNRQWLKGASKYKRLLLLPASINDVICCQCRKNFQEYSDWSVEYQHGCMVHTTHVHSLCWNKALHDIAQVTFMSACTHHLWTWAVLTVCVRGWKKTPMFSDRFHGPWTRALFHG